MGSCGLWQLYKSLFAISPGLGNKPSFHSAFFCQDGSKFAVGQCLSGFFFQIVIKLYELCIQLHNIEVTIQIYHHLIFIEM